MLTRPRAAERRDAQVIKAIPTSFSSESMRIYGINVGFEGPSVDIYADKTKG